MRPPDTMSASIISVETAVPAAAAGGEPDMVLIPGGTFQMGAESGAADQRPVHPVTVATFLMGVVPVTIAELASFVTASGYLTEAERDGWCVAFVDGRWERKPGLDWRGPGRGQTDDHPVTCVSWSDAKAYVPAVAELVAAQVG